MPGTTKHAKWQHLMNVKMTLICLEDLVPAEDSSPTPVVQIVILDGVAIINIFRRDFADLFLFTIQVLLHQITTAICEQTSCM